MNLENKGESIMSVIGIVLIWAWFAVAMYVLSRWPMGAISVLRQKYCERYES
jgi:hypothetical protein